MKEILMTTTSVHQRPLRFVGALSKAFIGIAMLSLAHCEAELANEEGGALGQAVKSNQGGDGPTCAAGDGCQRDGCPIPDFDCPPQDGPQPKWTLTGTVYSTPLSGFPGDMFPLGVANSAKNGVDAIYSNERSDEPCFVAIGTEDVNDSDLDTAPELDLCGPKGYNVNGTTLHADFLDTDAGGVGDHVFVNGVNVCMNADYDKVKGIAVAGVELSSDGTIAAVHSQSDDRAHCDGRWMSWEYCLAGQIATEVDFHFGAGLTPRDLTGIALKCRTVTPE